MDHFSVHSYSCAGRFVADSRRLPEKRRAGLLKLKLAQNQELPNNIGEDGEAEDGQDIAGRG
jgi:hypothetical protein